VKTLAYTLTLSPKERGQLFARRRRSERAALVGQGGQLRPAHADPRAAVVRMHDGAQAGIESLAQLAGRAALLMPHKVAADCRGVPLAAAAVCKTDSGGGEGGAASATGLSQGATGATGGEDGESPPVVSLAWNAAVWG